MSYSPPPERPTAPPPTAPGAAPAQYSPDGRWYWDGWQWRPVAPAGPGWVRPYAPSDGRATAAVVLLGVACAGAALLVVAEVAALAALAAEPGSGPRLLAGLLVLVGLFVFYAGVLGAAIAVPLWTHRAYRNLPALGATQLSWSPAWAAGSWFIPLANFVIPYLVVAELWRRVRADAEPSGPVVPIWWGLLVLFALLRVVVFVLAVLGSLSSDVAGIISFVTLLAAGILLITIIRQVTARERARYAQTHGYGA